MKTFEEAYEELRRAKKELIDILYRDLKLDDILEKFLSICCQGVEYCQKRISILKKRI